MIVKSDAPQGVPRFSVIVPTLNEAENIDDLLAAILAQAGAGLHEILLVDDGSTDGTREKMGAWSERDPAIRLISRETPDGLAGAVVEGARQAQAEVVVVMDADLSHPPEKIGALVEPVLAGTQDMMIGSRYTAGGSTPGWPLLRRASSRAASLLAWPLTDVRDCLSGFFAVRREKLLELGADVAGFKVGLEIILRGAPLLRVGEIPIAFRDRTKGRSKMDGRVIFTYLEQILGFTAARIGRLTPLSWVALALWMVALLIVFGRTAAKPSSNSVYATYLLAGQHWRDGEPLYTAWGGFVYSPLVAAAFAPFAMLPVALGNVLWRLINVAALTLPLWWWLRRHLHPHITRERYGLVFLLLLPLSLGNLNNGQANPLVIGLLMLATIGAASRRWTFTAGCVALATYLKMYPVVLGLLLVVMFPRQFTWRFVIALVVLGTLSFALQRPSYVLGQYHDWFISRLHDDRHLYKITQAPRDLWRVLHATGVPINATSYKVLQVASGGLLAIYGMVAVRRRGGPVPALVEVFSLAVSWMLLLGPSAESATYVLLAPVIILTLVNAWGEAAPRWWRAALLASLGLLLLALGLNSFTRANRAPSAMTIQPLAALLFTLGFCLRVLWPSAEQLSCRGLAPTS